jgi:hypothetical protein
MLPSRESVQLVAQTCSHFALELLVALAINPPRDARYG